MVGKVIALCLLFVAAALAADQCGVCMNNFVLCINDTSYKLCYDDAESAVTTLSPIDDEVYNCPSGEYCTNSTNVCEANPDGVNITAVCDSSSVTCGSCTGKKSGTFVCVSSTQFAICTTTGASNALSCNADQLCSEDLLTKSTLKKVCATQAVLDFLEAKQTCANDDLVTPTTTTATPVPQDDLLKDCSSANNTAAYFEIQNTANCRSYIYCERSSTGYLALEMLCRSGQFYSAAQKKCITAAKCPN
ncbi:uncharacterized protein LOC128861554 [Anastrepha ludens]|uniref:uncharacterized protein LOC128861554 n=1 Tax=Anastrepha ludens TaxID=28586 RepID=UPI0023AFA344|nr:uncharacterized protein LOC128861554 [Anastrepha ludens]